MADSLLKLKLDEINLLEEELSYHKNIVLEYQKYLAQLVVNKGQGVNYFKDIPTSKDSGPGYIRQKNLCMGLIGKGSHLPINYPLGPVDTDDVAWCTLARVTAGIDKKYPHFKDGFWLTLPDRAAYANKVAEKLRIAKEDYKQLSDNITTETSINVKQEEAKAINAINNERNTRSVVTVLIIGVVVFLTIKMFF